MQNKTVIYFIGNSTNNSIYRRLCESERYRVYQVSIDDLTRINKEKTMLDIVIYNVNSCSSIDKLWERLKPVKYNTVPILWFPEKTTLEKHEWCESYDQKVEFVPGTKHDLDILLYKLSSLTSKKNDFIISLDNYLYDNHTDNDLAITKIASALGYSKTAFYVRVKSIAKCSPSRYVMQYRLSQSKNYLLSGEYSISECAYLSGFNCAKYFSKCFKGEYGILPSEYLVKTI